MKELYYSAANINIQANFFLEKLSKFRDKHPIQLLPQKTALLVIDMQRYFTNENSHAFIPSVKAIIPKITSLQDLFLKHKKKIIHTQHRNNKENAGLMHNWWQSIIDENDPLNELITEVMNPKIPVITKTQYDAFWETKLDQQLRQADVSQLLITGVMTHLCCETTARAAFIRGYEVYFAIDGTATYNQEFHMASLLNLAHGFAKPILVDEVFTIFEMTP